MGTVADHRTSWRGNIRHDLGDISESLGKSRNYLFAMAGAKNREKWEFLQMLSADPREAIQRYREIQYELINGIDEILYEIEENIHMTLYGFSRFLHEKGVYTNRVSFCNIAAKMIRNPENDMHVDTYSRYAIVLMYFKKYREKVGIHYDNTL